MQDLPVMHMFERQSDHSEPIEDVVLAPMYQLPAFLLLLLVFVLDLALQVSAIRKVHHNAQLALLGFVYFTKTHDVGVMQHLQDFGFSQGLSSLVFVHILYVYLLDYRQLFVRLAFY